MCLARLSEMVPSPAFWDATRLKARRLLKALSCSLSPVSPTEGQPTMVEIMHFSGSGVFRQLDPKLRKFQIARYSPTIRPVHELRL
jgi:hypothetical protein